MLTHALIAILFLAASAAADDSPAARVDPVRLESHLRSLPTKRSSTGDEEDVKGLLKTEALLQEKLRAIGLEPTLQRVFHRRLGEARPGPDKADKGPEWHNIVVEFTGTEAPKQVIIVGAHFDAVPGAAGADDNGSGVAAVLEMARVLKDAPMRRTVRLALFNLEEAGLWGSQQHAAEASEAAQRGEIEIVGMLSLEMLGYYSDKPGSQRNPFAQLKGLELPTVGDFIALVGILKGRPFLRMLDEQMRLAEPACKTLPFDLLPIAHPDMLRSDHAPFLLRGIPAVMVTDTANFRNPHYHEPGDVVETLDLARYVATVRALVGGVHAMAGPVGKPDAPAPSLEGLPDLSGMLAPAPPAPKGEEKPPAEKPREK